MTNISNKEEMKRQYGTAHNLDSRIGLHQLFSTNKQGWTNWVFQNYTLKPNQVILELGCGNGNIWVSNADKLPHGTKLILSDFSSGMLNAAKENTKSTSFIEYQVIDAQEIPFENDVFDVVIANHMLYHLPDIKKALSEISRVIKPNGTFYATTIGSANFREIVDILHDYGAEIDFAQSAITDAFGLESGLTKLEAYFSFVEVNRYTDSLHITDPKPLVEYILSSQGIGNISEIISGEREVHFSKYISSLFEEKGYIDVVKDAGMFTSSSPVK